MPSANTVSNQALTANAESQGFLKEMKGSMKQLVHKCTRKKEPKKPIVAPLVPPPQAPQAANVMPTGQSHQPQPPMVPVPTAAPQPQLAMAPTVPPAAPSTVPPVAPSAPVAESGRHPETKEFKFPEPPAHSPSYRPPEAQRHPENERRRPGSGPGEYRPSAREWEEDRNYRDSERRYHNRGRDAEYYDRHHLRGYHQRDQYFEGYDDEYSDYSGSDYGEDDYQPYPRRYDYGGREVQGLPRPPLPPSKMPRPEAGMDYGAGGHPSSHAAPYMSAAVPYQTGMEAGFSPPSSNMAYLPSSYSVAPSPTPDFNHYHNQHASYSPTMMSGAPTSYPGIGIPNQSPYPVPRANYAAGHPSPFPQPPAGYKISNWGAEALYANPYDAQRHTFNEAMAPPHSPACGTEAASMQRRLSMPMA